MCTRAPPTPINLEEAPVDPREAPRAPKHHVDPGFFIALGVEPLEGRLLGSENRATEAPSAIVVNATLAEMLWPGQSAVGKRIAIGCAVAAVSTRYLKSLLFEVSALALSAFIGPAIVLGLAAAAAAWIPAGRAGRLPPADVLRSE